jgi:two-component system cell cycle sensor histidine kinase/response regulator CckA
MAQKPRLLLIDDSEATVAGLKSFLDHRYEVSTACNGLEGIRVFEETETKPDLVITDLVMPGISGLGVISLLKQQFPLIPIIAMTGWGKHPSELATEAKADTVLMKPFDLEDLDQSVSKLLTGKTSKRST